MQTKIFTIVIFVLLSTSLSKADDDKLSIGMGLMYFDYAEYDDNNIFLDGETGFIPGLVLKYKQDQGRNYIEWVGKLYGNTIDYDGYTQPGHTPLKTDSIAIITDTHFKIGMQLDEQNEPYFGLGFRYWYRNILNGYDINGKSVSGLLEEYYWPYLLLGLKSDLLRKPELSVGIDVRYTRMFSAKMDIDFLGYCGYDNASVDLGNRNGWRFSLPIMKKLNQQSTMFITPYYEIIDIGKSNTVLLTRNGTLVDCNSDGYFDGAREPRSETRNVGIEITWLF